MLSSEFSPVGIDRIFYLGYTKDGEYITTSTVHIFIPTILLYWRPFSGKGAFFYAQRASEIGDIFLCRGGERLPVAGQAQGAASTPPPGHIPPP